MISPLFHSLLYFQKAHLFLIYSRFFSRMNYSDDEAPLLSRQEQIAAQDRGLDDLASIIRRQRELGIMIGNEVEEQNGSF